MHQITIFQSNWIKNTVDLRTSWLRLFSTESSVWTCENRDLNITCGDGDYIQIKYANYGRLDNSTCKSPNILDDNCVANESLTIVAACCDGLQTCEIKASNGMFGDPCLGTFKYLEVRYSCKTGNLYGLKSCGQVFVCLFLSFFLNWY